MSGAPSIIEVEGLGKAYGALPALRALSFDVKRGESIALLGKNGSGKTTLLRLLAGLAKPTTGAIRIGGWDMPKEAMAARSQIGFVSHKPLLYGKLSARENLAFFGTLYGIPKNERQSRANAALERVGLDRRGDSLVRAFSRGMQQRLGIARTLLHEPEILLLDEPYTGLDQTAAGILDELIHDAKGDGKTLILSTHQIWRASGLARRCLILSRGMLAWDGETGDMNRRELSDAYQRHAGFGGA